MGKIAFLFAGQGAQYPGMGKSLYDSSAAAKAVFDTVESVRPGTIQQCFSGTKEELMKTSNTQPCVFSVDLAAARALEEAGIHADGAAGFSLGEVAALTFAGAFADDALGCSLVTERGRLMQKTNEENPGSMVAVLKLPNEKVEAICAEFSQMYPVNYNCPGQLVTAGVKENIDAFCAKVAEAGGRAKKLAVGGGFHSPLMHQASISFESVLQKTGVKAPSIPVYANYTAKPYGNEKVNVLARQIENPVRWQQTLENMAADGFRTFIEVGPGKTLSGFVKRTLSKVQILRVSTAEELEQTVQTVLG
ncbi:MULTISPECIES: ACP S-malonyltransferase [Caproicibacterium]|jgi:[acyl-carrier-protein] S-malonyltransferase|uniref:Malonyl CoA-acyl carrier protein transacylase n=1 Tax=Caproicibacterium lactatifermentans TaxID=2666138 RepID=A0A859DQA6_9FIRM|nr:ACP S-malonyltransferase [Caproicibacterium lactatifermentans]ARP50392.1 ACP S-malonyltransferase [Ruminococcaceae bacterium CPB6]MDD4807989.1 ACP S-malonyltransferase [Oscillospiraceae bacterium]QKN23886.1 acyltransferase domain-containing protein [Caproicibacterium lactatifermentans]QKO31044.1 acyltransferase domain-containing protein [Caproicibacterium lactatifermentans]